MAARSQRQPLAERYIYYTIVLCQKQHINQYYRQMRQFEEAVPNDGQREFGAGDLITAAEKGIMCL